MTTKELWEKVREENAEFLCYLCERWEDEKEYEDIQDYLKAIQKAIPEAAEITENPFGIICKCDDGNIHIQIELNEYHINLVGEIIK